MTKRTLAIISLYYLFLPLAIFLCSWVKPWIGIPLTLLLGACPLFMFKEVGGKSVGGTPGQEIIVSAVLLVWVVFSGVGGYAWQIRWDHLFRNAAFLDLVGQSWPVQWDGSALVYYIGFWLPPALVAKLTHSIETGFFMQLVYGFAGVYLAFRLMIEKIGDMKLRYLLPFIFFSGADILYFIIYPHVVFLDYRMELWNFLAFWDSNANILFNVYNQGIPAWVATMLMLNYGGSKGVPAITLCFLVLSAPFPTVGLSVLALYYTFGRCKGCGSVTKWAAELLNPYNIIAVIGVIPVGSYLLLNDSTGLTFSPGRVMSFEFWHYMVMLAVFEILVFLPFIYGQVRKQPEFYILFATSFLLLLFKMGISLDFNSRVELPLNFYMTLQLAVFLRDWKLRSRWCRFAFIVISALALVTPVIEIKRVIRPTFEGPRSEYRSMTHKSVLELDLCRSNFVTDSLWSEDNKSKLRLFRYKTPSSGKQ